MDNQKIINKGIIFFSDQTRKRAFRFYNHNLYAGRRNIFDKGEDIELCKNYIRIPERNIDGQISWLGCVHCITLDYTSTKLLTKSGQNMFVNVSGINNCTLPLADNTEFSFEALGYGGQYGCLTQGYSDIAHVKLQFTLLDEYKRDFCKNPIYNEPNISSENIVQKFQSDFEKLLQNPTNSDITFQCKDGGFLQAHKLVLTSRCEFFERMFAHKTVESASNVVQCDFKRNVMKSALEYIYSGKFDEGNVYELYEVADYYHITDLKMMCLKILIRQITSSNVISLLRYAESLNDPELKNRALTWITWKANYVKESNEYLELVKLASSNCESRNILNLVEVALEGFDKTTK